MLLDGNLEENNSLFILGIFPTRQSPLSEQWKKFQLAQNIFQTGETFFMLGTNTILKELSPLLNNNMLRLLLPFQYIANLW